MAYKIKDIYPSQVDTNDVGFPDGKPRNIQGGIQGTGTPFEEKLFQDYEGARQALFAEAGVVPSGLVDKVGTSDFVSALKKVANQGLAGKIFQSPTDGGLTEIQTRTVDANEVYEVRKTSDGSLTTIYSDAAGTTEIVQNGTSNVSDSTGVVEFYIAEGDYYVVSNGEVNNFSVAKVNVVTVDSIADLISLPDSQRREDLRYLVKGYHAGSSAGGGEFYYDLDRSGENDGSVIFGFVRIFGETVSVKAFGATGDGETDDTASFQSAIDACERVFIPDGTYIVDVDTRLRVPSNRIIEFAPSAIIKAKPTASGNYSVFQLTNVDNVTFRDAKLIGERDEHLGTEGETGLGIRVLSSSNITISGGWAKKFWGDGLYIGAFDEVNHVECKNVLVENFESYENRRQGASFTAVDGLTIRNCIFRDTSGTAPESGVDIEPNGSFSCTNVFIENCKFLNNAGGGLELSNHNTGVVDNVFVDSCRMVGNSKSGIRAGNATNVYITNCNSSNNPGRGIYAISSSTLTVSGGVYSNNGSDGVFITTGSDISVNGATFSGNAGIGISIRGSGIVRNSVIRRNSNRGIVVNSGSTGVTVDNCIVEDNGGSGVYAEGETYIKGCTVKANATSGTGRNIEIYADNCYITGTLVRVGDNANKPDYGLRTTGNSGLTVINNDFRNSGATGDIHTATLTGSVIEGNFPYSRRGEFSARPTENLQAGQFYYSVEGPRNEPLWYTFGGTWVDKDGVTYP